MRAFCVSLLILVFATCGALAQTKSPVPNDPNGDLGPRPLPAAKPPPVLFTLADSLDDLFAQLKRTSKKDRGDRISQRIWELWRESDNSSVNLLTGWAQAAIGRRQYAAALDLLDQVVVLKPTYAEGWNQRATLHFVMEQYGKSVADIERTLALEPRHFGALAGLANIQQRMGNDEAALASWHRALDIYPAMQSGQKAVIALEEKLAGREL